MDRFTGAAKGLKGKIDAKFDKVNNKKLFKIGDLSCPDKMVGREGCWWEPAKYAFIACILLFFISLIAGAVKYFKSSEDEKKAQKAAMGTRFFMQLLGYVAVVFVLAKSSACLHASRCSNMAWTQLALLFVILFFSGKETVGSVQSVMSGGTA